MKARTLLLATAFLLLTVTASQAGWHCGRGWGWGGGPRCYGGFGWGGGGYCGPGFGLAFAAPVVVVRPAPVYYYPAPVYATRTVYVRPATNQAALVRAQAQLARLGYYRGEVDGDFGPLTSRALALYQADNGLRVTGRLDSATLANLGT